MINGLCGPNYQEKDLAPQEENQPREVTTKPVGEWPRGSTEPEAPKKVVEAS